MTNLLSDEHPAFVWTPELYAAVEAVGLTPQHFHAANLEQMWQALKGSRIAPRLETERPPSPLRNPTPGGGEK